MNHGLPGIIAVILVVATYPVYAEDNATIAQDMIDNWTDIRNNHLVGIYFEKSYPAPDLAAIETVKSAIDLYEATRTEPQVQVRDRGNFVKHPTNPYGTTVVAFDVINSMSTNDAVYPFVIDVGTLKILAEGAFPGAVGLSATFLNDADRPLEDILADLQDADGTWTRYVFNDPSTSMYHVKHVWLSMYDGYIFGSGYYEDPDDRSLENIGLMIRMYDKEGVGSFADISPDYGTSFVLDAGSLDIVKHSNPDVTGSAIRDVLDINWRLETLSDILARHGSLWVSYTSPDPQPGSEYVRAHLQIHDDHIFGSGYGITVDTRTQSLASEAIQLHEMEGENAYPIITSMDGTLQVIIDSDDGTILAFAGAPHLINVSLGDTFFEHDLHTLKQDLTDKPGIWMDNIFLGPQPVNIEELRRSSWLVMHDGQLFTAGHIYSPERVAIETVDSAIALYKIHGKEAFDYITWQSVIPRIIYPFVVDTQTWELMAHAAVPERVGVCCAAPIAASNDLKATTQILKQNPGIWLEYTFYNRVSDMYEYKRTWLSAYDGYTFAAGYSYGNFEQLEQTIQDAITLYDAEGGDAAFAIINAMRAVDVYYPIILDYEQLGIVAHGQNSDRVGTNFLAGATSASAIASDIETSLKNDGDTMFVNYNVFNPQTGSYLTQTALLKLHDGYIFATQQSFVVYTR